MHGREMSTKSTLFLSLIHLHFNVNESVHISFLKDQKKKSSVNLKNKRFLMDKKVPSYIFKLITLFYLKYHSTEVWDWCFQSQHDGHLKNNILENHSTNSYQTV